jgi:anti-sigma-K factor RskA
VSQVRRLDCAAVADLAPLFVLGALPDDEAAAVRDHLATCPEAHAEVQELGGVAAYLAELPEPVEPSAGLKGRLMAAVEADLGERRLAGGPASGTAPAPEALAAVRERRRATLSWQFALQAAAVLLIGVLAGWNLLLLGQASSAEQRAALLRQAVAVAGQPGAQVASVSGTDVQPAARGFVVLSPGGGTGYLVVDGLAAAPAGKVYQAWYVANDVARSAGLVTTADGLGILPLSTDQPVQVVALTVEPAGGSDQPTSPIVALGRVGG